jgi:hypothetical protein
MSYKLKKNILIIIAEYVIANKDKLSDNELINNFYEMLMNSLDEPKQETNSDNEYIDDYIEINSDDEK